MAESNEIPYVPGTGGATVFGRSKALQQVPNTINTLLQSGLLNVKKPVDANQAYKDYQDNMVKADNGGLFSGELNGYVQKWVDKGAKYLAQGFDIFRPNPNDPKEVQANADYMKEKHQLESMSELAKLHTQNYREQNKLAQTGEYDEDGVGALHQFYDTSKNPKRLKEIFDSGVDTPTLNKAYLESDLLKTIKPASIQAKNVVGNTETNTILPHKAAIRYNVESAIKQNPQALRAYSKTLGFNLATDLLGTTDPDKVTQLIDDQLRSPGPGANLMAKEGITSYDSPEYRALLKKQVEAQLNREQDYNHLVDRLTAVKANEVDIRNDSSPNYERANFAMKQQENARSARRLSMEELRLQHQQAEWNEKKDDKNTRDKLIKGLQVGNTEDVQALHGILKAKGGILGYTNYGAKMIIRTPVYKNGAPVMVKQGDKEIVQMHQTEVDVTKGNDNENYAELNEVLNKLTGRLIPYDKQAGTLGYKGGLVEIGNGGSLRKEDIEYLREQYPNDARGLGDFFLQNGYFKDNKTAFKTALEILNKKGKRFNVK